MGYTGFSAKDIPKDVVEALVDAFAQLEQKVIMRFDPGVLPYVPKNVLVSNWVPQQDLLAHPKTVAFFTHGGIGSILESIYYGVPMIVSGIFADQVDNAAIIDDIGVAYKLDKSDLNDAVKIVHAISQVVENDSTYKVRSLELSAMWKDKPISPTEEATMWIERLLKHKTLRHLRMEQHDLALWQYFSLDVILFILGILGLLMGIIKRLFKRLLTSQKLKTKAD